MYWKYVCTAFCTIYVCNPIKKTQINFYNQKNIHLTNYWYIPKSKLYFFETQMTFLNLGIFCAQNLVYRLASCTNFESLSFTIWDIWIVYYKSILLAVLCRLLFFFSTTTTTITALIYFFFTYKPRTVRHEISSQ